MEIGFLFLLSGWTQLKLTVEIRLYIKAGFVVPLLVKRAGFVVLLQLFAL